MAYCSLSGADTLSEVRARIGTALGLGKTPASYSETLDLIAYKVTAPFQLAIDDIDGIPAPAIADLTRLVQDGPQSLSFTFVSRSLALIESGRLLSQGIATLCDGSRLAFDENDLEQLCHANNVAFAHRDVVRLIDATEGWAIVASGAIRTAVTEGRSLENAFEFWRLTDRVGFEGFFRSSLAHATEHQRALLRALIAGAKCDAERLTGLEDSGLYVVRAGHTYRPYRVLTLLSTVQPMHSYASTITQQVAPLQVRLFGRFQAEVNGHLISWIRRRDQVIFKYIALKNGGTVEREELARVFWPESEPQMVAQSVRTTCSNIRKAISRVVGYDSVQAYFRVGAQISISSQNVVIDVRRFETHADNGDRQYNAHELNAARSHYIIAQGLYSGRLFAGDGDDAWAVDRARELEDRIALITKRISNITRELGDVPVPSSAQRIEKSNLSDRPSASLAGLSEASPTATRQIHKRIIEA